MSLYHEDGSYPFSYEQLPRLKELLVDLDWDVVCLFDAGRWDYYDTFFYEAEPVASPGPSTRFWIDNVITDPTVDWSDVTYIHAHIRVESIEQGKTKLPSGCVSDAVGEYISFMDFNEDGAPVPADDRMDLWNKYYPFENTPYSEWSDTEVLTDVAIDHAEPPIIVHYFPPHEPLGGETNVTIGNVDNQRAEAEFDDLLRLKSGFDLAENGHISPRLLQLMYYHNFEPAIGSSERLLDAYDRVIRTADHGEGLGPSTYQHTKSVTDQNQLRIVPFDASWPVEVDNPEEYGAVPAHEWSCINKPVEDRDRRSHPVNSDDEQTDHDPRMTLEALGYK